MNGVRIAKQPRRTHFFQPWIVQPWIVQLWIAGGAVLGLLSSMGSMVSPLRALRVLPRRTWFEFIDTPV